MAEFLDQLGLQIPSRRAAPQPNPATIDEALAQGDLASDFVTQSTFGAIEKAAHVQPVCYAIERTTRRRHPTPGCHSGTSGGTDVAQVAAGEHDGVGETRLFEKTAKDCKSFSLGNSVHIRMHLGSEIRLLGGEGVDLSIELLKCKQALLVFKLSSFSERSAAGSECL